MDIFIIILLILCVLICIKINFSFEVILQNLNIRANFILALFSIKIKIKMYEISLNDILSFKKAEDKKSKNNNKLISYKNSSYMLIIMILDKVKFKKIHINIMQGIDDAAKTAIISGSLHAIFGNIFALVKNYNQNIDLSLKVNSSFAKKCFYLESNCILRLSIGNIITAVFKTIILKWWWKNGRASNTRFNDNSNAKY